MGENFNLIAASLQTRIDSIKVIKSNVCMYKSPFCKSSHVYTAAIIYTVTECITIQCSLFSESGRGIGPPIYI